MESNYERLKKQKGGRGVSLWITDLMLVFRTGTTLGSNYVKQNRFKGSVVESLFVGLKPQSW